jgi:hypothetical protein
MTGAGVVDEEGDMHTTTPGKINVGSLAARMAVFKGV